MEEQLFEWKDWDQLDTGCFYFYDLKLKVQIGDHAPGTALPGAEVSYAEGILRLVLDEDGKNQEKYTLYLSLGERAL